MWNEGSEKAGGLAAGSDPALWDLLKIGDIDSDGKLLQGFKGSVSVTYIYRAYNIVNNIK